MSTIKFTPKKAASDVTPGITYTGNLSGDFLDFLDDRGDERCWHVSAVSVLNEPSEASYAPSTSPAPVQIPDAAINHPSHYGGDTTYEAIKVIEAWGLNFNTGNAAKYISRAGKKSAAIIEDLKKAVWYLNREIDNLSK